MIKKAGGNIDMDKEPMLVSVEAINLPDNLLENSQNAADISGDRIVADITEPVNIVRLEATDTNYLEQANSTGTRELHTPCSSVEAGDTSIMRPKMGGEIMIDSANDD